MADIIVRTSDLDYTVRIQGGLLEQAGTLIAPLIQGRRAILVTDETVEQLYSRPVLLSLREAGFETISFAMTPGEENKNLDMLQRVYHAMHLGGITRKDVVVALGGGMVGDMAAFAAATYDQGIKLIHVPTTLTAQVDSAIGGQAAINTAWGRNRIGLARHPWSVLIDPRTLRSLPRERLAEGMAVVIKYGAIADLTLFERVSNRQLEFEWVIERCVRIISGLLGDPGSSGGERQKLTFGAPFRTAVQQLTGDLYYDGEALAIGMALAARFGEEIGVSAPGTATKLIEVLESWQLPVAGPSVAGASILGRIQANLQQRGESTERISLVLLNELGRAERSQLPWEQFSEVFNKVWNRGS